MNVADTLISLSLAKRRDRSMLSNALVKSTYIVQRGHLGLLREYITQAERSSIAAMVLLRDINPCCSRGINDWASAQW